MKISGRRISGVLKEKNYEELKDDPGYQRWLDSNGTIPFPEGEGQETFLSEHALDLSR